MRYSVEHREETRRKILDAADRRFRAEGYDGLGVDGLAREAAVTNGAFHGHFTSRAVLDRDLSNMIARVLRRAVSEIATRQ